jgi:hypothetical protein
MAAQHPVPQCARLASQTGLATSSFDDVTSSHHFNNNKSLHQTQMHAHPRPVRMHHSVDFDVWSLASDSGGSVSCDSSPSFSPFETPAASPLSTTPSIVENFKPPPTPPPSPPARYFSNEKESSFGGAIILERGALDAMHFAVDSNSQADAQKFISRTQSASETFEATPAAYARLYCDFSLLKVHMSRLEEQVRDQKQLIEELQRDNSRLKREVDVARTVPTSVLTHVARTANQSSASSNDDENLNPNVAKSGTEGNEQTSFVCKRCGMVLFHENNCISHETVAGGGRAQVCCKFFIQGFIVLVKLMMIFF